MNVRGAVNSGLLGMSALAIDLALWNTTSEDIGVAAASFGALTSAVVAGKYVVKPLMERLYHKAPGRHAAVGTAGLAALTVATFFAMPGMNARGAEQQTQ